MKNLKKIGIIGCGQIGYSTFLQLLHGGYDVLGYDTDLKVLENIENKHGSQFVTADFDELAFCDLVFACLPTLNIKNSQECDLTPWNDTILKFSRLERSEGYACRVFVQQSTCPPGTADIYSKAFHKTEYIVNPSFLTKADLKSKNFLPKRAVIGGNKRARKYVRTLYLENGTEFFFESDDYKSIELYKYIENAMDSTLISLWNEFLDISDKLEISRDHFMNIMENVSFRERFATSLRIPSKAFRHSCFQKDTEALTWKAKSLGAHANVLDATLKTNEAILEDHGTNNYDSDSLLNLADSKLLPSKTAYNLIKKL